METSYDVVPYESYPYSQSHPGEADFSTMSAANFPPQVESMVCRLSATTPAEVDRDATTHVDLSAEPVLFTLEPLDRPQATPLARFQAQAGQPVTNLAHESVRLSDLERHVLRYLDGGHDRPLLLEVLAEEVRAGRLVVHEQGEEIDDPERVQTILGQILDETLLAIVRKGLVMP